ncbi:NADH-quinone oxidoreductase subunit H [Oligoflexia bacterium]|nr:NADH-quinone oxidoreductase subunit H [Oligoflexia bacterium]
MAFLSAAGTYAERRVAGFIQGRVGPNRVGPFGILQPIADGIKLLLKEDVIVTVAFKLMYVLAPALVFIGALIPFGALPFSERLVLIDMELALYYILAFEALEVIGVIMAGWAPASKWSLYGGMRLAAQMLSYEIPLGLSILVVVILTGSLNLGEIVLWQSTDAFGLKEPWILGWTVFRSPASFLAFWIFLVAGLAAAKRAPFDLPEAESELVAGFHTEYSGMRFAFYFIAEYASMYLICALAAILFLGGWYAPIPRPILPEELTLTGRWVALVSTLGVEGTAITFMQYVKGTVAVFTDPECLKVMFHQGLGVANLLLKSFGLFFVMLWVRWTLPRIRLDHVMHLCLKVLLPFSLGCAIWALIQVGLFGL